MLPSDHTEFLPEIMWVCCPLFCVNFSPTDHLVLQLLVLRNVQTVHEIDEPGTEEVLQHIGDGNHRAVIIHRSEELGEHLIAHEFFIKRLSKQFHLLK